jgi:hypothetical protein
VPLADVCNALKSSTVVVALDVGFCGLESDVAGKPLLELLQTNKALRDIRLDGNPGISDEFKQQIEAALQHHRDAPTRGDGKQGSCVVLV